MQTTFINAQKGLRRGVTPQFELAWLFRIARNVCYNARASATRRGRIETARDLDALQDALATPDRNSGIAISDLTAALASIPERQRQALLLREFQGLSYEEIAAELGVTVAAVETLLFRARRSVAERLEQTGVAARASALTSVVAFLRWLLPGGAKVAAVAATATLAVTPGMDGPAKTPAAQISPPAPTPALIEPAGEVTPLAADASAPRPRTVAAPPVATVSKQLTPATDAPEPAVAPTPVPSDAPAPVSSSEAAPPTVRGPALPVVTPPDGPAPPVQLPAVQLPDVQLPDVQLPQVALPPVELPVDVPQVELPKLP